MDHRRGHFDPVPPLWNKVYDILKYWTTKGVDGFRCDMVEMVPIEFWAWVIPKMKANIPVLFSSAKHTIKANTTIIYLKAILITCTIRLACTILSAT
jgi:glycosidase